MERNHDEEALKGPAIGKMSILTKLLLVAMLLSMMLFGYLHLSGRAFSSILAKVDETSQVATSETPLIQATTLGIDDHEKLPS